MSQAIIVSVLFAVLVAIIFAFRRGAVARDAAEAEAKLVWEAANAVRASDRERLDLIFDALPLQAYGSLLNVAAECGDHDLVKRLIAKRVYVDASEGGSTALYKASARGHSNVVESLLANGADVDRGVVGEHPYDYDESGESPLSIALLRGHLEVARILVEHGADQYLATFKYSTSPEMVDLDSLVLASARRLREEGNLGKALPLYKQLVTRWDTDYIGCVPKDVLGVLIEFAETCELNGNWCEALGLYSDALYVFKQYRVLVSGAVYIGIGGSVDPEFFSEKSLAILVNDPRDDRQEIAALLRSCERVLGQLGRVEEQTHVAHAIKRLKPQTAGDA